MNGMRWEKRREQADSTPKVDATAIAVMSAGQFLSGAKAQRELGFAAQVPLEQSLSRALRWFRQQGYVKTAE